MSSRRLKRLAVMMSSGSADDWISCLRSCLTVLSHGISLLVAAVIVTFTNKIEGQMFSCVYVPTSLMLFYHQLLMWYPERSLISLYVYKLLPFNYVLNLYGLFYSAFSTYIRI